MMLPFAQLPAQGPLEGPLWSIVIPAALFLLAFVATYLLYKHFAD